MSTFPYRAVLLLLAIGFPTIATADERSLKPGEARSMALGELHSGRTYRLLVAIVGEPAATGDRVRVELEGAGVDRFAKELHGGDPDFYLSYRPACDGSAALRLSRSNGRNAHELALRVEWAEIPIRADDQPALEAEPNDSWSTANRLVLGRDVHGTADDVDYLENRDEGQRGLDWFRFEVDQDRPMLVYFQLDLLDRDVSANLRVFRLNPRTGRPESDTRGKDPMEIVHDRERVRYSKHLSRVLDRGTYFVEVNANHPDYLLRTRSFPVPPYDDPAQAVEAGMHYILNAGDAWFAQIPREGNRFVRSKNLHETATRCTACHASSFSTEANLVAHKNGYPIRSKAAMQYLMDRLANSPTPLYGETGLYWQRFIAIPLQSQGLQGGLLLDFEDRVSGQPAHATERFGPFLKAAWEDRTTLPDDEHNGVIPLDSKFEFAWRDREVLRALARRTGRDDYARAADRIAGILSQRAADRRAESLQDRIHRLHAWWLIDPQKFAGKIRRETGALIALQNNDGGWNEVDTGPGPSALYTTGQLAWTLLRIGLPRDHPAVAKALRYILTQQQDFGGWIQTTTHENFRTPMRETRYAVMALSEAFPRPGAPLQGWDNHNLDPARLHGTFSILEILENLENLWEIPKSDPAQYTQTVQSLLDHTEPLVRASAAACLGRIGDSRHIAPLIHCLGDPSKIVWRASAWALRHLGNRGIGHAEIARALRSPEPAIRRGAARIFAYQFYGMDQEEHLRDSFFTLLADPDLLTRLQAVQTLRQWFYRSMDFHVCTTIVRAFIKRMSAADDPAVRQCLVENLYIMMDENLGGGVSLQKNVGELPGAMRGGILMGRERLEREVLLGPILEALRTGTVDQRRGILSAFDGSFFRGRGYARRPAGMIDVGNDREFGFLSTMALAERELAFLPLLRADLPAVSRGQAVRLAGFFRLPEESNDPRILQAVRDRLNDPDEGVRLAAREVLRAPDGPTRKPQRPIPESNRPRTPIDPARRPSFAVFRDRVNPWLYRNGEDGYACSDCHDSHAILRIAPASDENAATVNYQSALAAIEIDRPESSPLLVKPMSPLGQGDPDPESPTGFTHVGGPRWHGPDHPAYRAILEWIQGN